MEQNKPKFKVGQIVKMTEDALENYGKEYKNTPFKIIYKATSINDHPGYDEGMFGMGLYDLIHYRSNAPFHFSLYDWELQKY